MPYDTVDYRVLSTGEGALEGDHTRYLQKIMTQKVVVNGRGLEKKSRQQQIHVNFTICQGDVRRKSHALIDTCVDSTVLKNKNLFSNYTQCY